MARQNQTPDVMFNENGEALSGTAMFRIQEIIDDQPLDQEKTGFYAGDIRDVCALCDQKNKLVLSLKSQVTNVSTGTEVSLPISDVKSLVSLAKSPPKADQSN